MAAPTIAVQLRKIAVHSVLWPAIALGWSAGAAAQESADAFNPISCKGNPAGLAYVALQRFVFALPASRIIGGVAVFPFAWTKSRAHPEWVVSSNYPPPPTPPDPSEHVGCPLHPAQRYTYSIDPASVACLLHSSDHTGDSEAHDEIALMSLPPNNPHGFGGDVMIPDTKSPGPYCGPEDADLIARRNSALSCLYKISGEHGDAWYGRGTISILAKSSLPGLSFRLQCSGAKGCVAFGIYALGLSVSFRHDIDEHSARLPIQQMSEFAARMLTALQTAERKNYPWSSQP